MTYSDAANWVRARVWIAVATQVAGPVLGLAGYLAARELARSPEAQARATDDHSVMPA